MDQVVKPMFNNDRLMQQLGAHLVSSSNHSATVQLQITEQHLPRSSNL